MIPFLIQNSITKTTSAACNKNSSFEVGSPSVDEQICSFELTTLPLPLPFSLRCQTTQPSRGMQIVDALPLNFWRNHSALLVIKTAFQITNIFPAPEQFLFRLVLVFFASTCPRQLKKLNRMNAYSF
jgi:hypothetical protein